LPKNEKLELENIPIGKLVMERGHKVNLREFRMGKYAITQAQYEAVMEKSIIFQRQLTMSSGTSFMEKCDKILREAKSMDRRERCCRVKQNGNTPVEQ